MRDVSQSVNNDIMRCLNEGITPIYSLACVSILANSMMPEEFEEMKGDDLLNRMKGF